MAQKIKADRGVSLTDAMIEAENALKPAPIIPESFTVTIPVKARVARWINLEFGGHPEFSIEDRLGAYLSGVLGRSRIAAMRFAEEGEDITEGKAVTLRRDQFARKAPKE
jgi:hypothetical protein